MLRDVIVKVDAATRGASGASAYQIALANGFVGTEAEWLASLDGVDSVVPGPEGDTAYEVAVANGFVGTEAAWLASLEGTDGESAYAIAVSNGFVGTEAEWLASLEGAPSVVPGPAGPPGDLGKANNRADLKAIVPAANMVRYLLEPGREGIFIWNPANRAAMVAIDTREGVYIPPASDLTGASGVWQRQIDGDFEAHWFGLAADDVINDAPAINAGFAVLEALGFVVDYGWATRGYHIRMGKYYCAQSIVPQQTTRLYGDGGKGGAGGGATILRFAAGIHGIDLDYATGIRAPGIDIAGLFLKGGFTNYASEGEFHGIRARVVFRCRDVIVTYFQGDGFNVVASADVGDGFLENANSFILEDCWADNCRRGAYIQGADVNAGRIVGCSFNYNRTWGMQDDSFLGNLVEMCHTSGNGVSDTTGTAPATMVSHAGQRYYVAKGQEVWASANAPSGTATDNQGWLYWNPGGVSAPYVPAWINGMAVRSGGSYRSDSINGGQCWVNLYAEGDQGYSQADGSVHIVQGNGLKRTIGTIWSDYRGLACKQFHVDGTIITTGDVTVGGNALLGNIISTGNFNNTGQINSSGTTHALGRTGAAAAADVALYLDNTNVISQILFRRWTAGAPTTEATIFSFVTGALYYDARVDHRFRIGGVDKASITAAGFVLANDDAYAVGWDGNLSVPTKNAVYDKIQSLDAAKANLSLVGAASGIAPLDAGTKIAAAYLPSYVDDILEFANLAAFPGAGETGKIYIAIDTGKEYRWSGTVYVELVSSPGTTDAVVEGAVNLYFTEPRVRASVLTGLAAVTGASINSTDSVLLALGKVQKEVFQDHLGVGGAEHPNAVSGAAAGFMSGEDKARVDANFGWYRTIMDSSGSHIAGRVAGNYGMGHGDPLAISGTGTLFPLNVMYIDPADYPACGSLTAKLRIRCVVNVNDVAPTGNYTISLHPVTRPGTSGAAGLNIYTVGAAVGTGVAVNAPAADSQNNAVGADFALPAAGFYVIGVVTTATVAVSSHMHFSAALQLRYT